MENGGIGTEKGRSACRGAVLEGEARPKTGIPETTKPLHFCRGFVLYGAAPGVEQVANVLNL